MMRLIDADKFEVVGGTVPEGVDADSYLAGCKEILEMIDAAPTIDAEPVRHGQLVSTGTDELYCEWGDCTVCGSDNRINAKFCNNCGAKLEGIVTK